MVHLLERVADVGEVAVEEIKRHDEEGFGLGRQRVQLDETLPDGEQHLLDLGFVTGLKEVAVECDLRKVQKNLNRIPRSMKFA